MPPEGKVSTYSFLTQSGSYHAPDRERRLEAEVQRLEQEAGTPAAVSSPGGNKQPGIGREVDLPWKAKHGTPSGSPLFPVRYL
jgi:hypothetical protein